MRTTEVWRARARTLQALVLLCVAHLMVAVAPFGAWRARLGGRSHDGKDLDRAQRYAAHVTRAVGHLPFTVKCLPQAMALSWLLRSRSLRHRVVLAVRPPGWRGMQDDLHAWVECEGAPILGAMPGPWAPVCNLGEDLADR